MAALDRWWPFAATVVPGRRALVAIAAAAGIGIIASAIRRFNEAQTTVNPLEPSKATVLVSGGIYRYTRNPMYLGLALLLVAWALWLGSASAWLGPLAFVVLIDRVQIAAEEAALGRLFGAEYGAYRDSVRRWFGRRA
ncbi:MAG: isoprenylcysteine carboxylmethyltransferase family protein [Proteobacteria bacterium]|nr:isoprenylcysteine carboxylmethyltransferase family protein [Pseudomonadota bacterium]